MTNNQHERAAFQAQLTAAVDRMETRFSSAGLDLDQARQFHATTECMASIPPTHCPPP